MEKVYHINLDGMGDAWYVLPILKKISQMQGKPLHIHNSSKPLTPVLERMDFVASVNKRFDTMNIVKMFDLAGAWSKHQLTLLNCNTTDYSSIPLLGFALTDEEKELKYPKTDSKMPSYDLVFHTAKTWNSRSISEDVWKKLYDKYKSEGYSIALVGKDIKATDMMKTSCVFGDENDNYINKLSLDDTINLMDNAKVFVTGQGGLSVLSAGINVPVVVAEGCVKTEYRYILRNGKAHDRVKYVRNPSGIYHENFINDKVTDDTRQQPLYEDMVEAIDSMLKNDLSLKTA